MRNLVIKRFLKYIIGLLSIIFFITGCILTSFADEMIKTSHHNFLQKSDGDDKEDDDDDDDDDDEGEEETHNAGRNCLTSGCHSTNREYHFSIGGTIYTDPEGTAPRTGAEIKIVDANGQSVIVKSDQLGNFYSEKSLTAPFTISASYEGREVEMPFPASDGGCNADSCHVVGMAGRIFINTADLDLTGTVVDAGIVDGPKEISYISDIKAILDAKCISCHKTGSVQSDSPLTTYEEVTDPKLLTSGSVDSLLIKKLDKNLSTGTMWPKLNSRKEFRTIKKWIVKYNAQESPSNQILSSEKSVSGAIVKLIQNGDIKYSTTTDSEGSFVIKGIKAGEYTLKVSKEGFETHKQPYQMNRSNVTPLKIMMNRK